LGGSDYDNKSSIGRRHFRSPSSNSSHSSNRLSISIASTANETKTLSRDNASTMTANGNKSIVILRS